MASSLQVFEIPTRPGVPQRQTISLADVTYILSLYWDAQVETWMLDIADVSNVAILKGVPLVTGVDLLEQYQHLNLGGALVVQSDYDWRIPPTFDNLGVLGHLFFIPTAAAAVADLTVPVAPQSRTRADYDGTSLPQPPRPPSGPLCPGAIIVGAEGVGWNFPPMADSPQFVFSCWLYISSDQQDPKRVGPHSPVGDLHGDNGSYLLRNTGTDIFISEGGASNYNPTNGKVIAATSTNPCVVTTDGPHGIVVGSVIGSFGSTSPTAPWSFQLGRNRFTVLAVTTNTFTIDLNASNFPPYPTGFASSYRVMNSLSIQMANDAVPGWPWYGWHTCTQIPHDQWVNLLISGDMNHPAGLKKFQVFYGDTEIHPVFIDDAAGPFNILFSRAILDDIYRDDHLWGVGTSGAGRGTLTTFLGEYVFAPGKWLDFTNPFNRALFHDTENHPVPLGADGSLPFGGDPPTLYLHQPPDGLGKLPVRAIDPCGVPYSHFGYQPNIECASLVAVASSPLLTFSFWIDAQTTGYILSGCNCEIKIYDPALTSTSALHPRFCKVSIDGPSRFWFEFPCDVGTGANVACAIDVNHPIGAKIVNAYVNRNPVAITVEYDQADNMSIDWDGENPTCFYNIGYVGQVWIGPGQFINPLAFTSASGGPLNLGASGEIPSGTAPAMYFNISGSEPADNFAINRGSGGAFTLLNGHFSLTSAMPFLSNASGLGGLRPSEDTVGMNPLPSDLCSTPAPVPWDGQMTADLRVAPPMSFTQSGITGYSDQGALYPYFMAVCPVFADGSGSDITLELNGTMFPQGSGSGSVTFRIVEFPSGFTGPQTVLTSTTMSLPAANYFYLRTNVVRPTAGSYAFGVSHVITGSWGGNLNEQWTFSLKQRHQD